MDLAWDVSFNSWWIDSLKPQCSLTVFNSYKLVFPFHTGFILKRPTCRHSRDGCQRGDADPPEQALVQASKSAKHPPYRTGSILHHPSLHLWVSALCRNPSLVLFEHESVIMLFICSPLQSWSWPWWLWPVWTTAAAAAVASVNETTMMSELTRSRQSESEHLNVWREKNTFCRIKKLRYPASATNRVCSKEALLLSNRLPNTSATAARFSGGSAFLGASLQPEELQHDLRPEEKAGHAPAVLYTNTQGQTCSQKIQNRDSMVQ